MKNIFKENENYKKRKTVDGEKEKKNRKGRNIELINF